MPAFTFETALLALVTIGLFVLARIVFSLREEIRELKAAQEPPASVPVAAPSPKPAPPSTPVEEGVPADVYAAIVSAIFIALGDQHRIVSITPDKSMAWSREGRRNIFGSHSLR